MADFKKKQWTSPKIVHFDRPEKVWAYYKKRASPPGLAVLTLLIERWRTSARERSSP